MTPLDVALFNLRRARTYSTELLAPIKPDEWFVMAGGVTHLAWKVGHLAMAEYMLALKRTRGVQPADEQLISADFIQKFGRLSVPDPNPAAYPPVEQIRAVFDNVHNQVLAELPTLDPAVLNDPIEPPPHRIAKTKLEAVLMAGAHEMIHCGQIGVVKRLLGYPATW